MVQPPALRGPQCQPTQLPPELPVTTAATTEAHASSKGLHWPAPSGSLLALPPRQPCLLTAALPQGEWLVLASRRPGCPLGCLLRRCRRRLPAHCRRLPLALEDPYWWPPFLCVQGPE